MYRAEKGRYFQPRGSEWIIFHLRLASHLNIFSVYNASILLVTLSKSLEPPTCLSSNCTVSNNYPSSFSLYPPRSRSGSFYPTPDRLQTALKLVSPVHPPQHARTILLKHSYKHVFLLVKIAVNSHCPLH